MRLFQSFVMLNNALLGLFMLSSCLQSDDLFLPPSCVLKTKPFEAQSCNTLSYIRHDISYVHEDQQIEILAFTY